MSEIAQTTNAIRRLLGDIEEATAITLREYSIALRAANDGRLGEQCSCAELQARYDAACEIIAKNITGGTKDRARIMVERQLSEV